MYALTKASFNILFPLLRPGGFYIIENWAWGHWRTYARPDHPWAEVPDLTYFVSELTQACGSAATIYAGAATAPIVSVSCYQGFVAVERGNIDLPQNGFELNNYIHRRTSISKLRRIWRA